MTTEFKIGDKVKYNGKKCDIDCADVEGKIGTIIKINLTSVQPYAVEFATSSDNFFWWMHKECLEFVSSAEKMVQDNKLKK